MSAPEIVIVTISGTASGHNSDVIMSAMVSQITSLAIVYSTVYSGADQRKHQNSASLASVRGIHRWLVNSPYKGPVMRKMFPFDDVVRYTVVTTSLCTLNCNRGLALISNNWDLRKYWSTNRRIDQCPEWIKYMVFVFWSHSGYKQVECLRQCYE